MSNRGWRGSLRYMHAYKKRFLYFLAYILSFVALGLFIFWVAEVIPENLPEIPQTQNQIEKDREPAELIKVIDGDTIKVIVNDIQQSIRLIGVDAPEQNICGFEQSTLELVHLLKDKNIFLESDSSQGDTDKYKRLLRYIFTEDGTNVNAELLRVGAAEEYTYNKDYKYKPLFLEAQNEARIKKMGIWGDSNCEN